MANAVPINTAAKRTLLQLVQAACNEMSLPAPTFVVGNLNAQVAQMLALANREGREYSVLANKNGGWQELRGEYLFNTAGIGGLIGDITENSAVLVNISDTSQIAVGFIASGNGIPVGTVVLSVDSATQVTLNSFATASTLQTSLAFGQQAYPLPTDFGYFMTQTFWDRAFRWQLLGPLEAQEWQVLKSGISPTGPRRRFRIMGNLFYIDPVPNQVNQEVFEYYGTGWCQSNAGIAQFYWGKDTDYYSLDDDCMVLGIIWRFLAAKRFAYAEERRNYDMAVQRAMARNGGARNLPLNSTASGVHLLNSNNVPDTGFGS